MLCITGTIQTSAQNVPGLLEGKISYISSRNIYVRFDKTERIENGDTLFIQKDGNLIPALIVNQRSSVSCLCTPLAVHSFTVSDVVYKRNIIKNDTAKLVPAMEDIPEKDLQEQILINQQNGSKHSKEKTVTGRISIASYSNFSNTVSDDLHRFRYTLSSSTKNISGSEFSIETYILFTHRLNDWAIVQENLFNALKIYNLALNYNFNESASIWAGRKINPHIANVGAIDGLQFEYKLNNFYSGVIAGTRPDFYNYGPDLNLFEYGVYVGQNHKLANGFIQSSVAFIEQLNAKSIDRRFIYFQHSNSLIKKLNLFTSVEADLFKLENNMPRSTISLISFFISLNYRMSKMLSITGSYDNRKNVIYYETFRNYADEILNQAIRQGYHLRINFHPIKNLNLGVNAGTRFRNEDPRKTKTLNSNLSIIRVPVINGQFSLTASILQTPYVDGLIYGARFNKNIIKGKLNSTALFRWIYFDYLNSNLSLIQDIGEIDLSYQLNKSLLLSVSHETTFQSDIIYNRLYINLKRTF